MEELMEILEDLRPDVDFETEDKLIDGGVLSSFEIITLVTNLNEGFDIEISPKYLIPENFNSAKTMWDMINTILDEE